MTPDRTAGADFTPWPEALARTYRAAGYWRGETFSVWLRRLSERYGDRPALHGAERGAARTVTYRDLHDRTSGYAAAFAARGLRRGDRVVMQLPNTPAFYEVLMGLLRLGVQPVLALAAHREQELRSFVAQTAARALITADTHAGFDHRTLARAVQAAYPALQVLVLGDAQDFTPLAPLDPAAWPDQPEPAGAAGTVALFQLSGGSTGTPKLIPRTHDDYLYSIRASAELCRLDPGTVFLAALPAAHNFTLTSPGALGTLHAGGQVVLAASPAPDEAFALMNARGVTHVALVPSALLVWLRAAPGWTFPALQVVQVGGAPLSESAARQVPQVFGAALQQVFGMAEGLVNYVRAGSPDDVTFRTQGRPISPHDEVLVVDDEDRPVPDGRPGHLLTRGPYTIRGYFRAPDHNARAFTPDGYYRTGDIVTRRPDGHLTVTGRHKDQINRGGEKIAAEEIEHALQGHPLVFQAALVGVPDPWLGERSCAFVQLREPTGPELPLELRRFLRAQGLADYKLPDRVEALPELPRTPFGKIDKPALRARLNARERSLP
ncbi:AMP-binding protein (plasmid) [Deinococcus taeanensis]|uniref:(2,3-dihydroxybenzoyl)adenylate synthase n=1 Tax=Deinococcus taeanensis TaxID=2737050 RepID=UPI001CDC7037|nr:AMP-binding protein [Deinococcus taeanensis]UBV45047.1 AMP-binding protein [Deinococcus taeanensis]